MRYLCTLSRLSLAFRSLRCLGLTIHAETSLFKNVVIVVDRPLSIVSRICACLIWFRLLFTPSRGTSSLVASPLIVVHLLSKIHHRSHLVIIARSPSLTHRLRLHPSNVHIHLVSSHRLVSFTSIIIVLASSQSRSKSTSVYLRRAVSICHRMDIRRCRWLRSTMLALPGVYVHVS